MKKVLSIILVVAMLAMCATVSVFAAEDGSYENPFNLTAGGTSRTFTVPAESEIYVAADDANGSTATITGENSSTVFQVYYCRQPVSPEDDGSVVFTMSSEAPYFTIINPTTSDIKVNASLSEGSGIVTYGTVDNPEPLVIEETMFGYSASAFTPLEAGNQGYYYKVIAPNTGVISVDCGAMDDDFNYIGWMWFVNNITAGKYGDYHWSDEEEPVYNESVKVTAGDELQIFVATYNPSNRWSNPAGNATVDVAFSPIGSWGCPEEIEPGNYTALLTEGNFSGYNYQWTATESGTATVAMVTESNWMYNISVITPDNENDYYGEYHWYDEEIVVSAETVSVNAGDILNIIVNTHDARTGTSCDGAVNWTLTFVPGEGNPDQGGGGNGDDGIGGDAPVDPNWELSEETLSVGTGIYAISHLYPYTVYAFEPTEIGKYTFSSEDSLIGIVSYNGMWITVGSSTDAISDGIVTETSFEWICNSVGQSIWVAALPTLHDTLISTITVDYEEIVIEETPREYYENTTTPEAFTFTGNEDNLEYVDTFDGVEDKAVLGADGYYHLNSENGPILFANLNDPMMSLKLANDYGQLKQILYGEDGEAEYIIDYTLAMIEYLECMDEETSLYPLTADLIEVFSKAGASLGWYGEGGWLGGNEEDCWMFACYYDEAITGGSDVNLGGSTDNGTGNDTNNNGTGIFSPTTGDAIIIVSALSVVALAAATVLFVIRRRKNAAK